MLVDTITDTMRLKPCVEDKTLESAYFSSEKNWTDYHFAPVTRTSQLCRFCNRYPADFWSQPRRPCYGFIKQLVSLSPPLIQMHHRCMRALANKQLFERNPGPFWRLLVLVCAKRPGLEHNYLARNATTPKLRGRLIARHRILNSGIIVDPVGGNACEMEEA